MIGWMLTAARAHQVTPVIHVRQVRLKTTAFLVTMILINRFVLKRLLIIIIIAIFNIITYITANYYYYLFSLPSVQ